MKKEYYTKLKVSSAPHSEVIIEGEIPFEILDKEYQKLLKIAYKNVEVPGFRAGKAPQHLAKTHINDLALLDKAAEEVFRNEYPEIVTAHKLFPIDHPQIQITKLAAENPLGFKLTVAVMPEIKLPDYKALAKEENKKKEKEIEITDKEVDATIENVRNMWAHQEYHKNHPEDTSHDHDHKMDVPELTDEFVKKLGDFKDVADLKAKVKDGLIKENTIKARDKKRIAIIEAIEKKFSIDLPKILVESELDRMMTDLHSRIASAQVTPAEYFTQIGKKEEDVRKEWVPDAEKRVKTEIILTEIAKKEALKPDPKAVEEETKVLVTHYKNTDPERARSYVEHMLTNDKVVEFLENL